MNSTHTYTAEIAGEDLPIIDGSISLDAGRSPHVQANIQVPMRFLELLDPRDAPRVILDVKAIFQGEDGPVVQERTFNLGVRRRPAAYGSGIITVDLASDEALLGDYRPLANVTAMAGMTSIRAVVSYVLDRAIPGAVLAPSDDRAPVGEDADEEALLWKAGESAIEFLHPLVQALGLRLVCDEARVWTLRDANYTGDGDVLNLTTGVNLIEAQDTIDRDGDLWFDARITRYRWTDSGGAQRERVDAFALRTPYSRASLVTLNSPYPGPGRSEYAVRRAQQRGREVSATIVADWNTRAEQPATFTFPDAPTQFGAIQTVEFNLANDEMTVTARTMDTSQTPEDPTEEPAEPVRLRETVTFSGDNRYRLHLLIESVSQNVLTNTSLLRRRVWLEKTAGDGKWNADNDSTWSLNIGGKTKGSSGFAYDFRRSTPQTISLLNDTVTITHESDGTKTVSWSVTATLDNALPIGTASATGSLDLPTIVRTSGA
ncbi:DUF859 family phage minor structural protein [Microbacterium dauci]|uniref:DUF859 family phage minor structural protein n=1 Tax=Microbacterium dauci TaxID=3048008 RepID=A0ABT6ZGY3_9MICO|nr:DUF859 family phage minor structural protein [Microbacterium sp. LX3-4]MDJ1115383.1 DUF859 family phage minor structural protein [Microbacterium sp. LX3-4]